MYEDRKCEYCGEQFAKNDDIVVCPDCGAPYHRACWNAHGVCAHQAQHGSERAYQKEENDAAETGIEDTEDFIAAVQAEMSGKTDASQGQSDAQGQQKKTYCESCGAQLIGGDAYCVYCGHKQGEPVTKQTRKHAQKDPLGGLEADTQIAGQKAEDMALVVRNNAAKFMPLLAKTDSKKVKIGWSWPAFIFGYLYFFFRKLYKYGLIVIMAQVLLFNVCNFVLGDPVTKTNQMLSTQYNTMVQTDTPTQEDYYKVMEATAAQMNESGITRQLYILIAVNILAVHIACALLFNALYLKHCKDTVLRMQESAEILGGMSRGEYRMNLLARGGVSIFGIFLGYFAKTAIEQLVAYIMTMFSS